MQLLFHGTAELRLAVQTSRRVPAMMEGPIGSEALRSASVCCHYSTYSGLHID